jgi:hypothetical protein
MKSLLNLTNALCVCFALVLISLIYSNIRLTSQNNMLYLQLSELNNKLASIASSSAKTNERVTIIEEHLTLKYRELNAVSN